MLFTIIFGKKVILKTGKLNEYSYTHTLTDN